MREIKFRAWDKVAQKMYYSDHDDICRVGDKYELSPFQIVVDRGVVSMDEFELMQYTGLKDRNGKEICEGDIVNITKRRGWDEVWSVEYDDTTAKFVVYNQLNSIRDFDVDSLHAYGDCPIVEVTKDICWHPEVIGNIYESPELLGVR